MSTFRSAFAAVVDGTIDGAATHAAFLEILAGSWEKSQIAAFIAALRVRGETPPVIAGAARAMREHMVAVPHDHGVVLDTCGTGGDGQSTLNLSTGAAVIAAAAGIVVAKHGNRAVSSKTGSADVLEALGVPLNVPPAQAPKLLKEARLAFLMAPNHHPAMRHAGPVRKELKVRTIFNILGPLSNPAGANHQLLGAFADDLRPVLAETLKALGTRRAWVVRGEDGLDELSPYGPTRASVLDAGVVTERVLKPEDFGFSTSPPGAAAGGEPAENATALEAILRGDAHPAADAVLLNGAGAIAIAEGLTPAEAGKKARELVASGAVGAALDRFRQVSRHLAGSDDPGAP